MEENKLQITLNLNGLTGGERRQLLSLIEKSSKERKSRGKALIGQYIKAGTRFKIINIDPHRTCGKVCIDEYVGKIGRFDSSFTYSRTGFLGGAYFEEEYMNAIDLKNGRLCFRYDEVELLEG